MSRLVGMERGSRRLGRNRLDRTTRNVPDLSGKETFNTLTRIPLGIQPGVVGVSHNELSEPNRERSPVRDQYRKGGPHDDVANNIRAQQQADAMPTAEEAHAEQQRWLAETGCRVDGCDEDDPSKLGTEQPVVHNCPARQHANPAPSVVCSGHARSVEVRRRERVQARANRNDMAYAVFTCGISVSGTRPDDPPGRDTHRHTEPRASLPATCRCGAEIEEVVYPDE